MPVDPTAETIRAFIAEDDGQPFVMLNLLAFDGDAGRATYAEYSRQTVPHLQRVGGEVLYFGGAAGAALVDDPGAWDAVLLVHYPSRAAFLEMVADPGYQEVTKLRTVALRAAVLRPTTPWPAGVPD